MFVNSSGSTCSREIHLIPAVLAAALCVPALTVIPHLRDEWRQCLCIYGADTLLLIPSLFLSTWPGGYDTRIVALLENKLRRRLRLPEPDRCAAGCRVPRMVAYRCLADRYHNHTSPLLSLTYWIKHLPSCSRIAHPPQNLEGKRLLEVSLTRV